MTSLSQRTACIWIQKTSLHSKQELHKQMGAFAEALMRFTPQIAIRSEEAIFLEIGKSLSLYSEASLSARIDRLARRLGFEIRLAFSPHASHALAKCIFPELNQNGDLSRLPIESL